MYCIKCGTPNNDTSKFCIKCGQALVTVGSRATGIKAALESHPASPPSWATSITGPKSILKRRSQARKDERQDLQPRTAWPYVAAALSLIAGVVLAVVAYLQIESGDTITAIVGVWNALVTLAYLWLALRLVMREEGAFNMGLTLSKGNFWWVWAQMFFWYQVAEYTGLVALDEEFLIAGFAFIISDLILFGGMVMTRRDLLPGVRVQDVPERPSLIEALDKATEINQAERKLFLDLRRRFIAHMSRKSWGGIEINEAHKRHRADLVARSVLSPAPSKDDDNSSEKRRLDWTARAYVFIPAASRKDIVDVTRSMDYVIAVAAPDEALHAASASRRRVGLYVLRDRVHAGKRSSQFEEFVEQQYGVTFGSWQ